jgi:hypothetical protein
MGEDETNESETICAFAPASVQAQIVSTGPDPLTSASVVEAPLVVPHSGGTTS